MEATSSRTIRVLLVEDQPKILKNQLKVLEPAAGVEIVGAVMSGEAALDELPHCNPDVLLLDLGLPRMSGLEVTRQVKARFPKVEILIFTIFDDESRVLEAIKAGASGYLLKGAAADKIVEAIRDVASGGSVIQPNLARNLLQHFRSVPRAADANGALGAEPETPHLSEREQEILQLIAKGVSNSEAARILSLSKATIRTHLEHLYQKLEVTNRVEAVTEGIRKGLIDV